MPDVTPTGVIVTLRRPYYTVTLGSGFVTLKEVWPLNDHFEICIPRGKLPFKKIPLTPSTLALECTF